MFRSTFSTSRSNDKRRLIVGCFDHEGLHQLQNYIFGLYLVHYSRFSVNYKKQLQHLNKCHRHLCTIWELCLALATEMIAMCRSRGQHGTHQPLYEVMAIVHWIYSLQPENTDILQNNIKGYPSVTTLMVSYSAVVNQFAQQRLCHHKQNLLWCHFWKLSVLTGWRWVSI